MLIYCQSGLFTLSCYVQTKIKRNTLHFLHVLLNMLIISYCIALRHKLCFQEKYYCHEIYCRRRTNMHTEKKHLLQRNSMVWLCALICTALWGSAFPCIKVGYAMFGIAPTDTTSQPQIQLPRCCLPVSAFSVPAFLPFSWAVSDSAGF